MNRKYFSLAAALMLILVLAACAPPTNTPPNPPTATPAPIEDTDHDVDGDDQQDADTDDAHGDDADTDDSEAMTTPFDGQALYDTKGCANCHGENRDDGFAPSLLPDSLNNNAQFYIDTITNGRGQMPSWADKFTPEEIEALVNWLMTTAE